MSAEALNPGDLSGSHVKIGAASHVGRNVGFLVGAVLAGGAIFGFYRYSMQKDNGELAKLESFRAAYAQKCDAPAWRNEVSPIMRDTYLNSSDLRATVETQLTKLNAGASCDDVLKALKTASFPMPAASAAQ